MSNTNTNASTTLVGTISEVRPSDNPAGLSCIVRTAEGMIMVRGLFLTPLPGLRVRATGKPDYKDGRGRPRFAASRIDDLLPGDQAGITQFLAGCGLPGFDERTAEAMTARFGAQTLALLDARPDALNEIFSRDQWLPMAREWWRARRAARLDAFLPKMGGNPNLGVDPYSTVGVIRALSRLDPDPERDWAGMLKANPYHLVRVEKKSLRFIRPVNGDTWAVLTRIGEIATRMGFSADAPERVFAGVWVELNSNRREGNTAEITDTVVNRVSRRLHVQRIAVEQSIERNAMDGGELATLALPIATKTTPCTALRDDLWREESLAKAVVRLKSSGTGLLHPDHAVLNRLAGFFPHPLSDLQLSGMRMGLTNPLSIVTGGPGCGKTTIIGGVAQAAREAGARVLLCAPTARAAKRMSTASLAGMTIHRALGLDRSGYTFDAGNPLDYDLVIVDEASMLDNDLALALFRAMPAHANVVIVGDGDQLPSVGPGDVLNGMIASGIFPVTNLTHSYRVGNTAASIVENAKRILDGNAPDWRQRKDQQQPPDEHFICKLYETDPELDRSGEATQDFEARMLKTIVGWTVAAVQKRGSLDAVQVIAPQHNGLLGCDSLNLAIQAAVNPPAPGKAQIVVRHGSGDGAPGIAFRIGDRVMQTTNDYGLDLMNGDIGVIAEISHDKTFVDVDSRRYEIPKAKLDVLELAYAITIHKSQGGEYTDVIIPLAMSQREMLTKHLLYTAITRAKERAILVGSGAAIDYCVEGETYKRRLTKWVECLKHEAMRLKIDDIGAKSQTVGGFHL